MPTYSYIALKNNKDIVRGKIDAQDVRSAREAIKNMGLLPTKISDDGAFDNARFEQKVKTTPIGKMKSFSLKDKIEFTQT